MKNREGFKNNDNGQGQSTSDRAFTNQSERIRENGISIPGGQSADQTSNKKTIHKPEKKKA